jgi:hypothetical protein
MGKSYRKKSYNKKRIKYSKNKKKKTKRVKRKKTKRTKRKQNKKNIQKGGDTQTIPSITYADYLSTPNCLFKSLPTLQMVYAYESDQIIKGIVQGWPNRGKTLMIRGGEKSARILSHLMSLEHDQEYYLSIDDVIPIRHADTQFLLIPGTNNAFGLERRRQGAMWQLLFHDLVLTQETTIRLSGAKELIWEQGKTSVLPCFAGDSPEGKCSTWSIFKGHGRSDDDIISWGITQGIDMVTEKERLERGEPAHCSQKAFNCIQEVLPQAAEKALSVVSTSQGSALFLSSLKDPTILKSQEERSKYEAGQLLDRQNEHSVKWFAAEEGGARETIRKIYLEEREIFKSKLFSERPPEVARAGELPEPHEILKRIRNIVFCSPSLTWGHATSCSEDDLKVILEHCKELKIPIILIDTEHGDQKFEATKGLWNKHIRQFCEETEELGSLNIFIQTTNHATDCVTPVSNENLKRHPKVNQWWDKITENPGNLEELLQLEVNDQDKEWKEAIPIVWRKKEQQKEKGVITEIFIQPLEVIQEIVRKKIQDKINEIFSIIYKWCKVYDPRLRNIYCKMILQRNAEIDAIIEEYREI